jgi:hypothetical protein
LNISRGGSRNTSGNISRSGSINASFGEALSPPKPSPKVVPRSPPKPQPKAISRKRNVSADLGKPLIEQTDVDLCADFLTRKITSFPGDKLGMLQATARRYKLSVPTDAPKSIYDTCERLLQVTIDEANGLIGKNQPPTKLLGRNLALKLTDTKAEYMAQLQTSEASVRRDYLRNLILEAREEIRVNDMTILKGKYNTQCANNQRRKLIPAGTMIRLEPRPDLTGYKAILPVQIFDYLAGNDTGEQVHIVASSKQNYYFYPADIQNLDDRTMFISQEAYDRIRKDGVNVNYVVIQDCILEPVDVITLTLLRAAINRQINEEDEGTLREKLFDMINDRLEDRFYVSVGEEYEVPYKNEYLIYRIDKLTTTSGLDVSVARTTGIEQLRIAVNTESFEDLRYKINSLLIEQGISILDMQNPDTKVIYELEEELL